MLVMLCSSLTETLSLSLMMGNIVLGTYKIMMGKIIMGTFKIMMGKIVLATYKIMMGKIVLGTYKIIMGTYKIMMGKIVLGTYKIMMGKSVLVKVINVVQQQHRKTNIKTLDTLQNVFAPHAKCFHAKWL
jgi:hypothetical protein